MKVLYKTTAVSTGGRNGNVVVENSSLKFDMMPPAEMGGANKDGVNPEQLFAAGYSACFGSALQYVIRARKLPIAAPTVQITISIGQSDEGGFDLAAEIVATLPGVDQATADALVQEAHLGCPYSKATRGNMDVTVIAKLK